MGVEGRFALPDLVRTRVERRAGTFDADHRDELTRLEIDEQRLCSSLRCSCDEEGRKEGINNAQMKVKPRVFRDS